MKPRSHIGVAEGFIVVIGTLLVLVALTGCTEGFPGVNIIFVPPGEPPVVLSVPDLIVDSVTHSPMNPSIGDAVTFTVKVKNQGTSDATGFHVQLARAGYAATWFVTSLAAGASTTLTTSEPLSSSPETFTATADNLNEVPESSETNNSAEDTITVAQPPAPPPSTGMTLIPAGSFQMGDSFGEGPDNELPVHVVYVSAFMMDKYEVAKGFWDAVAGWATAHGYDIEPADGYGRAPDHPCLGLSWYEMVKLANALSEWAGLTPCYTVGGTVYRTGESAPDCNWSADGYRLPTEAEWEKAARGGAEGHRFPWSGADAIQHARANYLSYAPNPAWPYDTSPTSGYHPVYSADNSPPYTSPAGSFAPNGYGLYDMAGNVLEWCWDLYSDSYYASSPGSDPRGPASGSGRVSRGGFWGNSADACRVAYRNDLSPDWSGRSDVGFRLVRTAP